MPPIARIVLACWIATAASGLFAQVGQSPQYPAPPARLDWDAEQQSLAQQYLTMPSDDAPAGSRSESLESSGYLQDTAPPQLLSLPAIPPRRTLDESEAVEAGNVVVSGSSGVPAPAKNPHGDRAWTGGYHTQADQVVFEDSSSLATSPSADAALPLAEPRDALPLQPPGGEGSESPRRRVGGPASMVTVVSGLCIVLGIFLVVAWGMRRAAPGGSTLLPRQVVEVLGRVPLAGRQQVHLVRCGNKLLLVSVTPDAAKTLTEITDPMEVDRLAGLCEQMRPHSSSATFRRALRQFTHDGESSYAS